MKKNILIQAPVCTRSGYGDHSRDIAYSIIKSGLYNVEIFPTNWGATSWDALDSNNKKHILISNCITKNPKSNPDIFIQITIPNEFTKVGKYNIGITAGIETDLCRPEWIAGCNNMDMVIGVSNHTLKVLQESRFDKHDKKTNQVIGNLSLKPNLKTEILFEGVDTSIFYKTKKIDKSINDLFKSVDEDFCFLFVGHWLDGALGQDRKDVGMLIRVFCEAFKNKQPKNRPALVLKTSGSSFSETDRFNINKKIKDILKHYSQDISVYLIHGHLTETEMNSLYNHKKIKSFVTFTKGEGFGRPMLEFSTTGKPIIASNWSGHTDFLSVDDNILLPGSLTPVHQSVVNDWFMAEAKWFTVNYPYAVRALQAIYDKYDIYLKKADDQRKRTLQEFTLELMEEKMLQILSDINTTEQVSLNLPKLKIPKLNG